MSLRDQIRAIESRWPSLRSDSVEEPIFILAAGWRSGSTLMQRMLMRKCFVWGEPYGRAMPIEGLAKQLEVFANGWPPDSVLANASKVAGADLSKSWVANLYPPIDAYLQAHRSYFTALLQLPANELGFERWGFKEVRLTADHATYLRWLFPRAKLVFLYRDPYACYRSFLALRVTYVRWPDQIIDSPERFGAHWRTLMQGYLKYADELGARPVRYEEFCSPDFDIAALNDYLGCELDMVARSAKVGASQPIQVPPSDWERLREVVEPLAGELGYRCPTS